MHKDSILAIIKKDLLEVKGNRAAWVPMLVVPLVFVILIPLAMILVPPQMDLSSGALALDPDLQRMVENMPPAMKATLSGLDDLQSLIVLMLGYLFAPFFLIFPLMFSTVIAAESFAGERERKTIEALLYTPASDRELFVGKLLAALIPAVAITWIAFVGYTIVVNAASWPLFGRLWFPLPGWYPLMFWVAPALALLGVGATVLISARSQTFMGAYQTSASLVVLVLALVFGQISGVLYFSVGVGLLVGLFFWVAALVILNFAVHRFNRTVLLMARKGK
ncbi:MAG: ABC transporter permease subunit [Anaerolineaceae bacterium]|nr:ABC transporter permease subunit [Anaerolineaceae bacterium]